MTLTRLEAKPDGALTTRNSQVRPEPLFASPSMPKSCWSTAESGRVASDCALVMSTVGLAGLNEKALNWVGALLLIGREARVSAYSLIRCRRQEAWAGRAMAVVSARQGQLGRCFPR